MKEAAARSLEYWASVRGDEIALIDGDATFTWRDWNDHADLLAQTLVERGIGRDDVIAVRTRTRMEWAVIAAAAGKVSARLLTFDRRLSPLAVRDVIIDSNAVALFVDGSRPEDLLGTLSPPPMRLRASIDVPAPGYMNFTDLFPPAAKPRFAPGFVALLVYVPTGPGQMHGMLLSRQPAAPASCSPAPVADTGASLVGVCLTSGLGCKQISTALSAGRRIIFMRRFDPSAALDLVERHGVTEWTLSTNTCLSLDTLAPEAIAARNLSSLKEVSAVTGQLDRCIKARLVKALGPVLFESYSGRATGPITVMPYEAYFQKPESCGRPRPGVAVEIRDSDGRPLPPNQPGYIWARAPGVIESYTNAIGPGPDACDAHGFLRIGDVGSMDEDGYLYVAGRAEDSAPRHPDPSFRVMLPRLAAQRAST